MESSANIRSQRLAGTIRKHLSAEVGREIADPRLVGVSFTEVTLSPDLTQANITVRIDYGDDGEAARRELLKVLGRMAPRLRSNLAPQLRVRRVPELRFRYDTGRDHARRIAEVLEEIREEETRRSQAHSETPESDGAESGPLDPKES